MTKTSSVVVNVTKLQPESRLSKAEDSWLQMPFDYYIMEKRLTGKMQAGIDVGLLLP